MNKTDSENLLIILCTVGDDRAAGSFTLKPLFNLFNGIYKHVFLFHLIVYLCM